MAITNWKDQWALVTGASSGIGRATARRLAQEGLNLLIVARREDRLQKLIEELRIYQREVIPVIVDIRNSAGWDAVVSDLQTRLKNVRILINNAGLAAGVDPVQRSSFSDWQNMVDTNILGLLRVTHSLLPSMCESRGSHIINIGSVAGRWTYPGGAVYCATKAAISAFSEGIRMDCAGTGIRVTHIVPGMVETEFSLVRLRDPRKSEQLYQNMTPLRATDIAESIWWALQQPQHVNIQEIVIFPTDQAAVGQIDRSQRSEVK